MRLLSKDFISENEVCTVFVSKHDFNSFFRRSGVSAQGADCLRRRQGRNGGRDLRRRGQPVRRHIPLDLQQLGRFYQRA